MMHYKLALIALGLIAFISVTVQSAKFSHSTSSVFDDVDEEVTVTSPSVPSSSSSNKRKSSYGSYGYGNNRYYDYSPAAQLDYPQVQSPYYSKYYSAEPVPLPSYTRHQRYVHPDYMSDTIPMAAASNSLAYNMSPAFGISDSSAEPFAAATQNSGGGHGGGGHGWHGHGHQHTNYKISAVNTDAIGLLGLLGLLGILQAVLLLLTTTAATTTMAAGGGGRKKRALDQEDLADEESKQMATETLLKLVLPSLNVVAQARIGKISVNCTQREVCKTNKLLVDNLGYLGQAASYRITDAIGTMIREFDPSESTKASIKKAGHLGRKANNSKVCDKLYPICKDLAAGDVYSVPVLLPPSHPLYYDNNVKARKLKK